MEDGSAARVEQAGRGILRVLHAQAQRAVAGTSHQRQALLTLADRIGVEAPVVTARRGKRTEAATVLGGRTLRGRSRQRLHLCGVVRLVQVEAARERIFGLQARLHVDTIGVLRARRPRANRRLRTRVESGLRSSRGRPSRSVFPPFPSCNLPTLRRRRSFRALPGRCSHSTVSHAGALPRTPAAPLQRRELWPVERVAERPLDLDMATRGEPAGASM